VTGRWSVYKRGRKFFSSEALNEPYVAYFGALGAAWADARQRGRGGWPRWTILREPKRERPGWLPSIVRSSFARACMRARA
jgi:hypothetical protein